MYPLSFSLSLKKKCPWHNSKMHLIVRLQICEVPLSLPFLPVPLCYCRIDLLKSKIIHNRSSSCRAISTDIPDPLSPPLPIVHRFRQVLGATSRIYTEQLYVCSSWSSCFCLAMWRGPQEYITYELIPTSPAVSRMPGSSNLDSFCDGW